jgi:hypothetical protein
MKFPWLNHRSMAQVIETEILRRKLFDSLRRLQPGLSENERRRYAHLRYKERRYNPRQGGPRKTPKRKRGHGKTQA